MLISNAPSVGDSSFSLLLFFAFEIRLPHTVDETGFNYNFG